MNKCMVCNKEKDNMYYLDTKEKDNICKECLTKLLDNNPIKRCKKE